MPALTMTAAALIAAGAGLGKGLTQFGQQRANANAMFGDAQDERLKELQRMEEMNALGLDNAERSALDRQLMSPVQAAQKEQFQRQAAIMGQADSSGRGLTSLMQQQERLDATQERVSAQIAMQDIAEARRQEEEMRKLQGAESASDAIKKASIYSLVGGTAEGAANAYLQQQAFSTMSTSRTGLGQYDEFSKLMGMYGQPTDTDQK